MYVLLAIETCVLTSEIVSHNSLATYLAIYGSKLICHLCPHMLYELRRMAKDLSEGVRGQIIALTNEGYSQRQVAAKIGVSKGAVQRTLERFKKNGFLLQSATVWKTKKYNKARRSVHQINVIVQ